MVAAPQHASGKGMKPDLQCSRQQKTTHRNLLSRARSGQFRRVFCCRKQKTGGRILLPGAKIICGVPQTGSELARYRNGTLPQRHANYNGTHWNGPLSRCGVALKQFRALIQNGTFCLVALIFHPATVSLGRCNGDGFPIHCSVKSRLYVVVGSLDFALIGS